MVSGFFMFIARLCIVPIFLLGAYSKFVFYDETFQFMAAKHLPMIPVLLVVAALVELIGSISLIFGYKTRFGAILLMLFLIPVTYFFHDFWNYTNDAEKKLQIAIFFRNLAIFGGLLFIASVGPGKWACDWCSSCCRTKKESVQVEELHKS